MDAGRLDILIRDFLQKNFSLLTLDLLEENLIVTENEEGFTAKLILPKQTAEYIKGSKAFKAFADDLRENNFALFHFAFEEKPDIHRKELTLEEIEKVASEKLIAGRKVDKVCRISDREYLLGTPIKERPVKIEFLRVSPHEQIIAGTISFLTKREFKKKKTFTNDLGNEITTETPMPYWTFVLDDGTRKQSCVYFSSSRTEEILKKNITKMENLDDGKTICVIGINDERNGRVNFNVRGISTCVLG